MRIKYIAMLFALLAFSALVVACSSDDDSSGNGDEPTATSEPTDNGNGDEPTATPEPTSDGGGNGGGGFGTGTGTLTIGTETWEITGVGCVFSAEEARNPAFPFNLSGFGESATGARSQLSADIYDPSGEERHEGDGVSHNISFNDIEDFESPSVSWSSYDDFTGFQGNGTITQITIDGKNIHGAGDFDDGTTDELEGIPGTMDISCP